MKRILSALLLTAAAGAPAASARQCVPAAPRDPKATPAYALLAVRKASVEAELKALSKLYTAAHPDVRGKRFELNAVMVEMEKMRASAGDRVPKLSDAYGKLVLRKVAVETELDGLRRSYAAGHPEVSRKRDELLALGRELEELLR
ncbi:MAG: hypothetical protein M3348_01295 [Acidobacteriota bacterium]|nr:hypothetical protein [Acidobacteriota bacterium]